MRRRHVMLTAGVCTALALWGTPSAAAEDPPPGTADALNGVYTYLIEDSRFAVWSITSTCDPAGNCFGHVVSSRNWAAPLTKGVGGAWTIQRDSPTDGWVCPDGSPAAAHYAYTFDPATLNGSVTYTKAPGACGNPDTVTDNDRTALRKI